MTDEKAKEDQHAANEAWQEVGRQFRALGESLASAFSTTWHSEETRQHLKGIQAGLETMVERIGQVTKEVRASGDAQKVQVEVEKAAKSAKSAGQEIVGEVQPHLLSAFRKIRVELDQMISRLEESPSQTAADEDASASEEVE
jgi:hypothetical protein